MGKKLKETVSSNEGECKIEGNKAKNPGPEKKSIPVDTSKDYFVGTLPHCPRQNLTFSGISFPLHTSDFKKNPNNGTSVPVQKNGLIISLDDSKAKDVKEAILKKVFRRSLGKMADLVVKDEKYIERVGDEPASKYVYMILVSEIIKSNSLFRDSEKLPEPVGAAS